MRVAASLRAGLPTQIVAFFGDQPLWGRRESTIGAGPAPTCPEDAPRCRAGKSLEAMDTAAMRPRAAELRTALARERGVEAAIEFLK
jgi:UDP:flavonoid glycosyltransferase YjiC (YdhE family)